MIKIPIGDWFLARSEAFHILVEKFKLHKKVTKTSFSRVKNKHYVYDRRINELQARVRELESTLEALQELPVIKVKKKKR